MNDIFSWEWHECPTCHMPYAASREFFRRMNETNGAWHCPQGHRVVFTESVYDRVKRDRDRFERERNRARVRAERARRSAASYAGWVTRLKREQTDG